MPQSRTRRASRARGAATRERIIRAAIDRFARDGYLATTVADIAAEAGTAVQTLYLAYGSKVGILTAAHDVSLVGDQEPVPLLERPWVGAVRASTTVAEGWEQTAEHLWSTTERVAPVYSAIRAATADPDVAALAADLREQRATAGRVLAEVLLSLPGARPDADLDRVADIIYATMTVETYELLVTERGWPVEAWRAWTHHVVARELHA